MRGVQWKRLGAWQIKFCAQRVEQHTEQAYTTHPGVSGKVNEGPDEGDGTLPGVPSLDPKLEPGPAGSEHR